MTDTTQQTTRRGLGHRLYHGETSFDFIGPMKRWFALSALVILVGLISLGVRGLNFGIDFRGGTVWEVPARGVSVADARDALGPLGQGEAKIQIVGNDLLRVQGDAGDAEDADRIRARLARLAGVDRAQVSQNTVGPSWGEAVTSKAQRALVFFFIVIAAYLSLKFEWKMAVAALAAVVHDIFVTVGVYSVTGLEVTPATVISFLTILGFSLYDTIVVFDKVEENTRGLAASGRLSYSATVNLSMNQVLMRSLNTSIVAVLPIVSVLVVGGLLGATTLREFGVALLIGLVTGAYSSIFIAAPILALLKEREPRYASIKQRIDAKGGRSAPLTPAAAMAATGGLSAEPEGGRPGAGATAATRPPPVMRPRPGANQPPRGRKKGKRR